jgi:octaprenyl-diphosphate synthase
LNLTPNGIDAVYALAAEDMRAVNQRILGALRSDVDLVNQLGQHIVNSGGKRLRPMLVVLAARACGYRGRDHITLATVIEFIHTATLLHDDVVDGSLMRRGIDTANSIWGSEAAVLVGDFLYSRAFEMMVELGNMQVMDIMAHATNTIAEGEVMQLVHRHNTATSEERYLEVIYRKTAKLFEAASRLGAVIGERSAADEQGFGAYGKHLGTAYQLIDDLLDYSASSEEIGKNVGDDLAEGKATLPLIYTMQHGTAEQADLIRGALQGGDRDEIKKVATAIESSGAIAYTARSAEKQARLAIDSLPDGLDAACGKALLTLADFTVRRTY